MSRKIILLNLVLLALAGTLVWQARKHYLEIKAHEREILQRSVKPTPVLPPPSIPAPQPVAPVQYAEVAQKTLFSRDRNPNVIIEVPPPKPEPPMPALPVYFGQLDFGGDPIILLSIRNGPQKRFHVGEKIGDFELVSFDRDKVTFAWNNKQIEKKIDELKPKPDQQQVAEAQNANPNQPSWMGKPLPTFQAPGPPAAPGSSGPQIKNVSSPAPDDTKPDSPYGQVISGTDFRACSMSDPTPDGKVVDGYRKIVTMTLMGKSCHWEKVK